MGHKDDAGGSGSHIGAKEQRQAPRHKGCWPARMTLGGQVYAGQCQNISTIGLGVTALQPLPVGAQVTVKVELTQGLWIQAEALIVRQQIDPSPPPGEAPVFLGLRFLKLDAATLIALHSYLAKLAP